MIEKTGLKKVRRRTGQHLLADLKPFPGEGSYDIYPAFKLDDTQIFEGFESLAAIVMKNKSVIIYGYAGRVLLYSRH